MTPNDPRHGSEAGFSQHRRDGEDPCLACQVERTLAGRRRSKRKEMGIEYRVDSAPTVERLRAWREGGATYGEIARHTGIASGHVVEIINQPRPQIAASTARRALNARGWPLTRLGATRRVRALTRMGYSCAELARLGGPGVETLFPIRDGDAFFLTPKVKDRVARLYDRLNMVPSAGPAKGVTRARNLAIEKGWPPPLAWNDIDDPNEQPTDWQYVEVDPKNVYAARDVDPVVVMRLLEGVRVKANVAERVEALAQWKADGGSEREFCMIHGWKAGRYGPLRLVEAS